ncbi:MAG TPA: RNA polymerase sigma factor [Solirubrobacterales bacterium]|jgi:RNA polymerase sigma factor (sigma-70 family)|nr:RNA polymerase sigma factor [Solirubrobacterales bacterium]
MSEATVPSGLASAAAMTRVLSDDRLARRAVDGDERAFATIFDRYHQRLYRYCLVIVGNSQDAQDALQNTMVKVLRALPGEERRIELKPWLYRIAHNESIELLRRRRETRQLDAELAAPGSGLAEEAASRERLRRLLADLEELPERQRGVLVMRELAGLEFDEIGIALGTSSAVARQTLYEARLGLRQMDEGREMSCETVTKALSKGDGRISRRRDLRAHLRGCPDCRRFGEEIKGRERDLAALSPLPGVAAAGLLQGLLGGPGAGGGLAGTLGGGAAKSLGASAVLKGAATVAVVAAIGVGADRGGLIDVGPSGDGGSQAPRVPPPRAAGDPTGFGIDRGSGAPAALGAAGAIGARPGARVSASRAAARAAAKVPGPPADETGTAAAPAPISQGSLTAHPHGRGHEKRHPSAAAHGQQTAATHKAASHGSAGTKSHPAHPPKPSHPPHPSTPSSEKGPASPASGNSAAETQLPGEVGGTPPPPAAAEEATPGPKNGKKP